MAVDLSKFVDVCSCNTGATRAEVRLAVNRYLLHEDYMSLPFGEHIVDVYCTLVDYLEQS